MQFMVDGRGGQTGEAAVWLVVVDHEDAHAPVPIHLLVMAAIIAREAIPNHNHAIQTTVQVRRHSSSESIFYVILSWMFYPFLA